MIELIGVIGFVVAALASVAFSIVVFGTFCFVFYKAAKVALSTVGII